MRVFSRLAVTIIFIVSLGLSAWAADTEFFEYKEYEVQRGDTLWDITNAELEDPFNWPIVWRENPQIQNPDLIFPGQIIRIPVSLLKKPAMVPEVEVAPAPKVEVPKPPPPPAEVPIEVRRDIVEITTDDILRSGYISMAVPGDGIIVAAPLRGKTLGLYDEIYIKRIVEDEEVVPAPFHVGDKFYVVRNLGEVYHPETEEFMGYLIKVLGIVEVERIGIEDVTARITTNYEDIEVGDVLDTYYEVEPLLLTGDERKPEVSGFVVASHRPSLMNSQLEVVYIDKGKNAGLKPGDVIATLAKGSLDRENGVLRVIDTRDETSTTWVLHDVYDVNPGHGVASCAKVEGCTSVE